jgi:peptide/nickel transport system permease protein
MTELDVLPAGTGEAPLAEVVVEVPGARRRTRHRIISHFRDHPVTLIAVGYLLLLAIVAIFAPVLAPHDPNRSDLLASYRPPSGNHLLGTDDIGRDVLSRLMFGARTSLVAAVEAVGVSTLIGTLLGLCAGYYGRRVDTALSRVNDALMSVPPLILALAVVAVLGPGLTNAMFAVGIVSVPRVFRVVRASAIDVGHTSFVEASVALGCRSRRVLFAHILPNAFGPLLVVITVSMATAVLAEAGLSYLGLGVQPPTPSWGGMLAEASKRLDLRYLIYPPGIALALTVGAFTVVGDGLRAALGIRPGGRRV